MSVTFEVICTTNPLGRAFKLWTLPNLAYELETLKLRRFRAEIHQLTPDSLVRFRQSNPTQSDTSQKAVITIIISTQNIVISCKILST